MKRLGWVTLVILVSLTTWGAAAEEDPQALAQKATAAYDSGRYSDADALFARLEAIYPRSIRTKLYRARIFARQGKKTEALEQLGAVSGYGARFDPADAALASLQDDSRFEALVARMRARTAPLVRGRTAFLLDKDLIPENIAYDPKTGAFFVGSMYKAKIVKIDGDGNVSDFVPPRRDGLLSVLGMKADPVRRELWVNAGNFIDSPPMENDAAEMRGKGAIFRFDLDTARLIRSYPAPGGTPEAPLWFNDLVVAPNGDVYATAGPDGLWVVRSGASAVERYLPLPGKWINGIALTEDGRTLFAAAHAEGVLHVDVATKEWSAIDVPQGATLGGIDGLYVHEGSLVGVQNGIDPIRVIRAWLDPSLQRVVRFEVLEQDHPLADIPLTGTIVGDELYYVARSQLRSFENGKIWPMDRLKETVILKLPLEVPAPPPLDLERERTSLLEMQRREIRAHVEHDAAWLAESNASEFVAASNGAIDRMSRDDVRKFFEAYFEGVVYHQYENLEPPVAHVSDDGSMGWVLSRVKVRRTQSGKERSFVYAGMMVYEKQNGRWVRVSNASTFASEPKD